MPASRATAGRPPARFASLRWPASFLRARHCQALRVGWSSRPRYGVAHQLLRPASPAPSQRRDAPARWWSVLPSANARQRIRSNPPIRGQTGRTRCICSRYQGMPSILRFPGLYHPSRCGSAPLTKISRPTVRVASTANGAYPPTMTAVAGLPVVVLPMVVPIRRRCRSSSFP